MPKSDAQNNWLSIKNAEKMDTFFSTIVSDEDLWMYIASNGGLSAGRVSSELSLFPYYTHDKIMDLAHTTGPFTVIKYKNEPGHSANPGNDIGGKCPVHEVIGQIELV